MGNRAVITTPQRETGIYLHWNGGPESVAAFLKYCELQEFRAPDRDPYGFARLAQVIANFFGGGLSIGIESYTTDEQMDPGDNGVYIVKGWEIAEHIHHGEYLDDFHVDVTPQDIYEIDRCQPKHMQISGLGLEFMEGLTPITDKRDEIARRLRETTGMALFPHLWKALTGEDAPEIDIMKRHEIFDMLADLIER